MTNAQPTHTHPATTQGGGARTMASSDGGSSLTVSDLKKRPTVEDTDLIPLAVSAFRFRSVSDSTNRFVYEPRVSFTFHAIDESCTHTDTYGGHTQQAFNRKHTYAHTRARAHTQDQTHMQAP